MSDIIINIFWNNYFKNDVEDRLKGVGVGGFKDNCNSLGEIENR